MNASALLILSITLPIIGMVLIIPFGGRWARNIATAVLILNLGVAALITAVIQCKRQAIVYASGGWAPPLGIQLRADGLSAVMLLTTALIALAAAVYAPREFSSGAETRKSLTFWTLLAGVCAAMNTIFLGNDFFNLYVALELLTFAAVPLVCMSGGKATLEAALRYLLFALSGSALYLLGVALLYGACGTLDIGGISSVAQPGPTLWAAIALMTIGLAAKTALFPLHLWLPPAHAGAPPVASALLSALVVKGSFFLAVRLWFDAVPGLIGAQAGQILGIMGTGAIVAGGVMALRQERLKLLIAYSTVAQIGYLFLMFPMMGQPEALPGGMFQAVSHAFAKAAMFMAAGLMAEAAGSDRLDCLRGVGRTMPLTACAFILAALSLTGIPPTGGFAAKWLLLSAAFSSGQWWWALAIFAGGLLAGGYMFRALSPVISNVTQPAVKISRTQELAILALAICALLPGIFPQKPLELLSIGRPKFEEARP